jgi:hypothetical protein
MRALVVGTTWPMAMATRVVGNNEDKGKGRGELTFVTPRYSFSARKETDFYGTQHKIQKFPRKNKLRFVARPKLPMWLFPLLEVRPPPP